MSQPSIASFFNSRKRAAADDLCNTRNKVIHLDNGPAAGFNLDDKLAKNVNLNKIIETEQQPLADGNKDDLKQTKEVKNVDLTTAATTNVIDDGISKAKKSSTPQIKTRRTTLKRTILSAAELKKAEASQPKIVRFTLAGTLSPKKKYVPSSAAPQLDSGKAVVSCLFGGKESIQNVDRGMKTPTKEQQEARALAEKLQKARNNMSLDDIKTKVMRSSRLDELKNSLNRLQSLEESRQRIITNKTGKLQKTERDTARADQQNSRAAMMLGKSLKQFETIELEVLSSPKKGLATPTKPILSASPLHHDEGKNELMSPKKTAATPRRLFSPVKGSPTKSSATLPAYQRFQSLATESCSIDRSTLQMPYKYRCLSETFKCVDTVCSMFFNRKETITMKKLKPAVQRMLRKNFTETSLAQINYLYPDAFKFHQKKMLNPGSHTKYDYYQLIITPIIRGKCETTTKIKNCEDNIIQAGQDQIMNPQTIIERHQKFNRLLLSLVLDEHDRFLKSLDPPMTIPRDKITRWHPEFDVQMCPDVQTLELPQPPNVEKFSSAKDILATARNLFNCSTPMERVMERYEEKQMLDKKKQPTEKAVRDGDETAEEDTDAEQPTNKPAVDPVASILKGVPKSLLEKIRAKQAAKALDAMTRRPSQDKEIEKYSRLPELARYLRNIFVTESKSVLEQDIVMAKLQNSFRERLSKDVMKELLQLIAQEGPPNWLTFHHIRKTDFVKMNKTEDLAVVIGMLERKAQEKNV